MKTKEIEKIVCGFWDKLGYQVDVKVQEQEGNFVVDIMPEDEKTISLLIGYRGENLFACQHLLRLVARKKLGEEIRLTLDVNKYRQKQSESLEEFAKFIAEKVKKTKRVELLRPMSAYERRIVHLVVSKIDGLITQSVGEEPNKRVMIKVEASD